MKKFWLIIAGLYMAFLLTVSVRTGQSFGGEKVFWLGVLRNCAHIPAYTLLTLLWIKVLHDKKVWTAFTIAVVYGIFNEFLQGFVPGREASLLDVGSNMLGAGAAVYLVNMFKVYRANSTPRRSAI